MEPPTQPHSLLTAAPKHSPAQSISLFGSWPEVPPEQTPQSSRNASPPGTPAQSSGSESGQQASSFTSMPVPPNPENVDPLKHICPFGSIMPSMDTTVNTPSPAGINAPERENPNTKPDELVETRKPASWAEPPEALIRSILLTENWKPYTSSSFCIYISTEPPSISTLPNDRVTGWANSNVIEEKTRRMSDFLRKVIGYLPYCFICDNSCKYEY